MGLSAQKMQCRDDGHSTAAEKSARSEYDKLLAETVAAFEPDWIILPDDEVTDQHIFKSFSRPGHQINPALPGTFPGTHAIERLTGLAKWLDFLHGGDGAFGAG